MTPEQLRDELANDNRIDSDWNSAGYCAHDTPLYLHCEACAVERVTAKYSRSNNPFLQEMAKRCNPHAPCPTPDSCNADQICIYRCQWFADTEDSHRQLRSMANGETWFKPTSELYQRHTVNLTGPAPHYVEDELLAVERGWKRAKVAWVVMGVLVVGYVVWRACHS